MDDSTWQRARLIPTSGINGPDEAERRATSALLAVVGSVREFGLALIKPLGAPAGLIETFIEVPFESAERTIYGSPAERPRADLSEAVLDDEPRDEAASVDAPDPSGEVIMWDEAHGRLDHERALADDDQYRDRIAEREDQATTSP